MTFTVESAADPISWLCVDNGNPAWIGTRLTWNVTEGDDSRVIEFTHSGFEVGGPPYESTRQIWGHFVSSLDSYLAAGRGQPWD